MSYRCVSMPNMATMSKNSSAKATEIRCRSMPNLKFNFTSDIRKPELSAHHSKGLLDGRLCVSAPNIPVYPNLAGEAAADIGCRSTPNLKFSFTNDIQRPESSKNCDFMGLLDGRLCASTPNISVRPKLPGETAADIVSQSTPNLKFNFTSDIRKPELSAHHSKGLLDGRLCVSAPNIPVYPNLAGEAAADIGCRSTPNLKFSFTNDIQRPESSKNCDFMGLLDGRLCASTPNISVRPKLPGETAADIVSQSTPNLKFQQVTSDVRKPESPRHRHPRRSFWRQTKKFVRRLFCCCGSTDMIDQ